MSRRLRAGIIGCGKVAHLHATALSRASNAMLAAVFSRSAEKGSGFASRYSVSSHTDVEEMIHREELDFVILCTPHPYHKNPALNALECGVHVLVEKPMASTLQDCDAMITAAEKAGKNLGIVSQRRFYAPCERMHRAIQEGKIGRPALGTVQMLGWRGRDYYQSDPWRGSWTQEGGGVLVNQAPHQLDLLQWFMDDEPEELYGIWKNINHPEIEVEDSAIAVITFKNGGLANLVLSNSQKPGIFGKVHIHGSNGASVGVQTDGGAMFIAGMSGIQEPPANDLWSIPGEESFLNEWVKEDSVFFQQIDPMEFYIRRQIEDFSDSILEKREPAVRAIDGRRTVELFTAIYRSHRDRKPVRWPLFPETERSDMDGRLR